MFMNNRVILYDTTLRDGMQYVGSHFTVEDKVRLALMLDKLGIDFIEGGSPAYNPKDAEFFRKISEYNFNKSKLVAFGSTCHAGTLPENDKGLNQLAELSLEYICLFGKAWKFHAEKILGVSAEENLLLIKNSIEYLVNKGKKVIFDAEHFFDGYKDDNNYAVKVINTAFEAGAEFVYLCDTNGGTTVNELIDILKSMDMDFNKLGIHAHNDIGMATALSVTGVQLGLKSVQTTLTGIGERCGNADIFEILPTLQLKSGFMCVENDVIKNLSDFYYKSCEILNQKAVSKSPFVGRNAFSHKGGTHIDAVIKDSRAYEHINPEEVGNSRRMVLSEMSGRAAVTAKIKRILPDVNVDSEDVSSVLNSLKDKEFEGFQYEGADASFELLVRRTLNINKEFFKLNDYKIVSSGNGSSAIVDVFVDNQQEVTAANGHGPVDALDSAFRKALGRFYPELNKMRLVDYKVRVLDSTKATASKVRVIIESGDGHRNWVTVGVSEDIIEASWLALVDAHEYMLYSSNSPKNSGL